MKQILKSIREAIINNTVLYPKQIIIIGAIITLVFLMAFPNLKTDTDPVHMLDTLNPAVLLHNKVKKEFNISDIIAVGIQTKDKTTLFTPKRLAQIKHITDEILKIKDVDGSEIFSKIDLLSISTIDDIIKNKNGELLVAPLMKELPQNQKEANLILKKLNANPMVGGKIASNDGSLVGIFMPLIEGKKSRSYYLSKKIKKIMKENLLNDEQYYFAGLPVAETTFGNEMFVQMGVFAPMAGLVIFLLLLLFFRSWKVVLAPMILSFMAVIWSMGALIYSGNVIHIMSSMIPIFIMPIAVLDSVHILSVLSKEINSGLSKVNALKNVLKELFTPMFYTSLTTVVGFLSLASTGIPPVIVFGLTIAFGVAMSFILTIVFIPAYTMLLSDETLKGFGTSAGKRSAVNLTAKIFEKISWKYSKAIVAISILIIAISIIGVKKIIINDNPVRWFKTGHPLRIADVQMNNALAGTYMSNLIFSFPKQNKSINTSKNDDSFDDFSEEDYIDNISIKNPIVINYIDKVSTFLKTIRAKDGAVMIGGTTSIADVLKKIGKVAFNNSALPKTQKEISQYMFLFESGDLKKGRDLWKLITPNESKTAQMWVHFKSGDNQNMILTEHMLSKFMQNNRPPILIDSNGKKIPLIVRWSGLMHINKIWQNEMVHGMGESLIGSFLIVFLMMIFLFRSLLWAIIAMLPLTLTITFIYGSIGFAGKFYDMPIAVLSSLTLGLSIDFAIHFIEQAKNSNIKFNDYAKTLNELFQGTAQAIWRNVLVIAIGFVPLFFASLQPYFTVGMFFFLIMIISGSTTLLLLPAILKIFHKYLPGFKHSGGYSKKMNKFSSEIIK